MSLFSKPEVIILKESNNAKEYLDYLCLDNIILSFSTRNFRTSVLDVNYPISVCLNNVAKTTVCFCWTNLVSIIEVANSNVK